MDNNFKENTKKSKDGEKRRRKRKSNTVTIQDDEYLDSMVFLEMQMFQMDEDDDKIIVSSEEDKTQEEIIIDEILSMPIDTLINVKQVPDRLLSASASSRRMSTISNSRRMSMISRRSSTGSIKEPASLKISLPSPLGPSYLPTKPVAGILAPTHHTERLYRYTHIEGIIYPPGYMP